MIKVSKKELARRYTLFVISLFFIALGIAFTKHGELGVSPISSVANILSCKFTSMSLGTWLVIWNCVMIAGQIIILRRDFKLIQLLQVPLSFVFGSYLTSCLYAYLRTILTSSLLTAVQYKYII